MTGIDEESQKSKSITQQEKYTSDLMHAQEVFKYKMSID